MVTPRSPVARGHRTGHEAPAAKADAYHHGRLRDALLAAAQSLLLERGVESFTLRECARRAGVSHAAPAHHFGDARGLLTAFATVGFERMADLMQRYVKGAGPEPEARLCAVGQAYVDFALAHRAHFQLMFASGRLDSANPALQGASLRSFEALQQSLLAVMQARGLPMDTLPQRLLLAWSAVHGYATLLSEGQCLLPFGLGPADPALASAEAGRLLALLQVALAAPVEAASRSPGRAGGANPPRAEPSTAP
jgi:AcrR family transcriptional regulator